MIFGSIIAAGVIGILIAPMASRMLRFFPPVVTGTIILVIGITLMRIGINWIFGNAGRPDGAAARQPRARRLARAGDRARRRGAAAAGGFAPAPTLNNPAYAPITNIILSLVVLGDRHRSSPASPRGSCPTSRCCSASWSAASSPRRSA